MIMRQSGHRILRRDAGVIPVESTAILPRAALIPILVCLGMRFATETTVAQCPKRGTVVVDSVSNTRGKPYEAKEVQTVVTYDSDGTKRVVVTKSNLFPDSRGRIRQERFYDGTDDHAENVPTDTKSDKRELARTDYCF